MPTSPHPQKYLYVSQKRRVREDRRFITGRGQFAADYQFPGMLHIAMVTSPYACATIKNIDYSAALSLPGVRYVLTGQELFDHTNPLLSGLDLPKIKRIPLAHQRARYAGEWVAAVVAETRYVAEDAVEHVNVDYEPLPFVIDAEEAMKPDAPLVHPEHGSNILCNSGKRCKCSL